MPGAKHSLLTAAVGPSGTGDVEVIAVGSGVNARKSIYVVSIALVASAASVISFKSATNALTGGFSLAINGGFAISAPGDDSYLFRTNPGENLVIAQSVDGVDGFITYYFA